MSIISQATTESLDQLHKRSDEPWLRCSFPSPKRGEKLDLERPIEQFERALNICPRNRFRRAAARSNMAREKFIRCRVYDTDLSLDVHLTLYLSGLAARPASHLDQSSMLIQLASALGMIREKGGRSAHQGILHEAMELSSGGHDNRAALFLLQLARFRPVGNHLWKRTPFHPSQT